MSVTIAHPFNLANSSNSSLLHSLLFIRGPLCPASKSRRTTIDRREQGGMDRKGEDRSNMDDCRQSRRDHWL